MIVADGLLGFLTPDEVVTLLDRLTSHVPTGEIAFNGYPRFAIRAVEHTRGTRSVADLIRFPGSDDPHDPERWDPALSLVREILIPREPEVAQFPRPSAPPTGWPRTARPGPARGPSCCTTASDRPDDPFPTPLAPGSSSDPSVTPRTWTSTRHRGP